MLTTAEDPTSPSAPAHAEPPPRGGPVILKPARRWLRADEPILTDALHLATGHPATVDAAAVARLQRRGLAEGGIVVAWVGELLRAIATARRRLDVTLLAGGEVEHHTAWLGAAGAVLAERDPSGSMALEPVTADLVPAAIALRVGHGPRPLASTDEPRARVDVLARFTRALGQNDPAVAAEVLRDRRLRLDELRVLHGVASGTIRTWQVEASVPDGRLGGEVGAGASGRLAVLDGGPAGTWIAGPGDLDYSPATGSTVWQALLALAGPAVATEPTGTVTACPSCRRSRPSAASSTPC